MSKAEVRGGNGLANEVVAVESIRKQYVRQVALEDLSLTLRAGEVLGLIGANGGGKTTTLRILAGILKPDRGRGHVLGFDLLSGRDQIREHVGYMSQRLALYADLTVSENLRFRAEIFGLRDWRAAVETTIREFDLAHYARARAKELSGGWMRKLQLAAALIHSPMMIFLDEPTAGLDALSCHDVWRRIERLAASGVAVIVSSHDLGEAERCSRVALLSAGQLLASGTPDQIIQGTSAVAFLLSGLEARTLQQSIERTGGVIATYPQGESLRVVGIPGLADTLSDVANSKRLKISPVPMRLEDAVLTFLHNPDDNHKAFS